MKNNVNVSSFDNSMTDEKEHVKNLDSIEKSFFFDVEFYKNTYDLSSIETAKCAEHYYYEGWKKGFKPSQYFDLKRFFCGGESPVILTNPLVDYLKSDKKFLGYEFPDESEIKNLTKLESNKVFDASFYLAKNVDVKNSGMDAALHYVRHGWMERRAPSEGSWINKKVLEIHTNDFETAVDEINSAYKEQQENNTLISTIKNDISTQRKDEGCRQIDVLIVIKNAHLASSIWRAKFFCESLRVNGFKSVVRTEKEAEKLIANSSIVFFQKFTGMDAAFKKLLLLARDNSCEVWGDLDDLFHPEYIKFSGQALSGLWDEGQQQSVAKGFVDVVELIDTLLVSSSRLKKVFENDYPEKKVYIRRNKLPARYFNRSPLPKLVNPGLKLIYPSGSLSHQKDFEPISDIIYDFLKRFKDSTLTLIGGESVQVPKKLLERKNVRLLPRLSFDEMMLEIEKSDLMLVPLLINPFNDAKSNIKFIESAAMKVPVITTSVFEFSSYIKDGKNGFIENDFSKWGERLIDFRRSPQLLQKAGENAYETVSNSLVVDKLEIEVVRHIRGVISSNIKLRYPSESHQKYPNWLLEKNKYFPLIGRGELINRVNEYIEYRASRGKARFVIYTCLSNSYDSLKVPEYLDKDIDYICFTDRPVYGYGVWQVKAYDFESIDATRISRHPKILPHVYLNDYEASIYIDANIMPVESMTPFFHRLSQSGCHVAGVKHPWRDCIYEEAKACLRSGKDKPDVVESTISFLKKSGFPEKYGLFENNFIYRKHNETDVIQAMEIWWQTYSKYSKRDQLSYMFALHKANICPEYIFTSKGKNVRNVSEFLYFSHFNDDVWTLPLLE